MPLSKIVLFNDTNFISIFQQEYTATGGTSRRSLQETRNQAVCSVPSCSIAMVWFIQCLASDRGSSHTQAPSSCNETLQGEV